MKATIKLKLHICPEAETALLETLRQSTACFNAVCLRGWETTQRNGTRLHHATYKPLREAFPALPSQLHCAARIKATEALKSVDARLQKGRKAGCPTSKLCPVRYDARSYWVRLADGQASLATVAGRVSVAFRPCGYYSRYMDWLPTSADLCFDPKRRAFFLHVVMETAAPAVECKGVLGVDFGLTEIATDSEGNTYSGEPVKAVRRRMRRLRGLLQAKGTKSAKRHLKRIRQKQSRFTRNTNHVISKHLVSTAAHSRKALALEKLTDIRDRADTVSRHMRWLLGNWSFYQLRDFVTYKAQAAGLITVTVDPRNTSRTCSECGYCDKANRKSQASFVCLHCGFCANADINASRNIEARGYCSEALLSHPTQHSTVRATG